MLLEQEYSIKPIGVKYICDNCNVGEMLPTGNNNWIVNPPTFEHSCSICKEKEYLKEKYPLIRFENIYI